MNQEKSATGEPVVVLEPLLIEDSPEAKVIQDSRGTNGQESSSDDPDCVIIVPDSPDVDRCTDTVTLVAASNGAGSGLAEWEPDETCDASFPRATMSDRGRSARSPRGSSPKQASEASNKAASAPENRHTDSGMGNARPRATKCLAAESSMSAVERRTASESSQSGSSVSCGFGEEATSSSQRDVATIGGSNVVNILYRNTRIGCINAKTTSAVSSGPSSLASVSSSKGMVASERERNSGSKQGQLKNTEIVKRKMEDKPEVSDERVTTTRTDSTQDEAPIEAAENAELERQGVVLLDNDEVSRRDGETIDRAQVGTSAFS